MSHNKGPQQRDRCLFSVLESDDRVFAVGLLPKTEVAALFLFMASKVIQQGAYTPLLVLHQTLFSLFSVYVYLMSYGP